MKILVIGGGGREHALCWKLTQSRRVTKLYCAPGNAGIADLAECVAPASIEDFAAQQKIDLTIVGPEAPLCAGIVDAFQAKGLKIFGPTKRAAQLEGSKAFCKRFLLQHGIPTADAGIFDNPVVARDYVRKRGAPIVVKADGLAAGKGVVVAQTIEEAERAIDDIMVKRAFGEAGKLVVIEECLTGEETRVMALVDGKTFKLLPAAQDHKRVGDGDTGPNTGGMGVYSPAMNVDATEIRQQIPNRPQQRFRNPIQKLANRVNDRAARIDDVEGDQPAHHRHGDQQIDIERQQIRNKGQKFDHNRLGTA
jgi:phosphoribosylamine--glycine ligase